jgi:hypothetical protein
MNLIQYTKQFAESISTPISQSTSREIKGDKLAKPVAEEKNNKYQVVYQGYQSRRVKSNNVSAKTPTEATTKLIDQQKRLANGRIQRSDTPTRVRSFRVPNEIAMASRYKQRLTEDAEREKQRNKASQS